MTGVRQGSMNLVLFVSALVLGVGLGYLVPRPPAGADLLYVPYITEDGTEARVMRGCKPLNCTSNVLELQELIQARVGKPVVILGWEEIR